MRFYHPFPFFHRFLPGVICTQKPKDNQKTVYITFDDGPYPTLTEWLLNVLDRHQIPATFFLKGEQMFQNPLLTREILSEGHQVGNHTFSHLNGWRASKDSYMEDILRWEDSFYEITKRDGNKLFRPPYGKLSPYQFLSLRKKGYQIVLWSLMTYDFDHSWNESSIINTTIGKTKPGSILVFHENDKTHERLPKILPAIIDQLKKEGYTFKSL